MEPPTRKQEATQLLFDNRVQDLVGASDPYSHSATKYTPPLNTSDSMLPPPDPKQGQIRPLSFPSRTNNRLSLSLPIQAVERDFYKSTMLTQTSSNSSTRQASPAIDVTQALSLNDPGDFLVALASQERRVLELKEELSRAESELKRLKRRWAVHEASQTVVRSRVETKNTDLQITQLKGSGFDETGAGDGLGIHSKRSLELDRRKAILVGATKDSRRKVIRGGHTRALSLLSPIQVGHGPALQSPTVDYKNTTASQSKKDKNQEIIQPIVSRSRNSYQDSATSGVKQIAEDIKLGLWSFMEDLRQATVGDEAVKEISPETTNITQNIPGKKDGVYSSAGNLHRRQSQPKLVPNSRGMKGMPTATSHEAGEEIIESLELKTHVPDKSKGRVELSCSLDDDWLHWDSPISNGRSGRWSNSTTLSSPDEESSTRLGGANSNRKSVKLLISHGSPVRESNATQPVQAISSTPKRGEMSWPDLNSLTPNNLKRTASIIVKEWEKSLNPLTGDRK